MDASISDDPRAPDDAGYVPNTNFRSDRWRRAGATADEISSLAEAFDAMTASRQHSECAAIDATSDNALAVALEAMRNADDFGGYQAAPEDDEVGEPEDQEPQSTAQAAAGADEGADAGSSTGLTSAEQTADRGPRTPTDPIEVDGTEYPTDVLDFGWFGTVVGDVHLVAATRAALAEKVRAEVS